MTNINDNYEQIANDFGDKVKSLDSQINTIAKDLIIENGKLYLKQEDGTKIGLGVTLPSSGGSGIDESKFMYVTKEVEENTPCDDITLDNTSITFTGSGTQTIIATLTPPNTTDTLSFVSGDNSIVTVSPTGVVTAVGNGSTTITITCGKISKTCNVSVSGITVTTSGRNLLDYNTMLKHPSTYISNGALTSSSNFNLYVVPVKPNTTYCIQANGVYNAGYYAAYAVGQLGYMSDEDTVISGVDMNTLTKTSDGCGVTFTTPEGCNFIGIGTKTSTAINTIQVEEGNTIHDYYLPYSAE